MISKPPGRDHWSVVESFSFELVLSLNVLATFMKLLSSTHILYGTIHHLLFVSETFTLVYSGVALLCFSYQIAEATTVMLKVSVMNDSLEVSLSSARNISIDIIPSE